MKYSSVNINLTETYFNGNGNSMREKYREIRVGNEKHFVSRNEKLKINKVWTGIIVWNQEKNKNENVKQR